LLQVSPRDELVEQYLATSLQGAYEISENLLSLKVGFIAATGALAERPLPLHRFKSNLVKRNIRSDVAVGALMLLYIRNRDSCPN
jgi:hypothetical protein